MKARDEGVVDIVGADRVVIFKKHHRCRKCHRLLDSKSLTLGAREVKYLFCEARGSYWSFGVAFWQNPLKIIAIYLQDATTGLYLMPRNNNNGPGVAVEA